MNNTMATFRYISTNIMRITFYGLLCILGTTAITELVFHFTNYSHVNRQELSLIVPSEVIAGVFALLIGLVPFSTNFKVTLANGVSRKTFLLANLPIAVIASAFFSIFNLAFVAGYRRFWPITIVINLIYPHIGWVGLLLFQFTLYFLLIFFGWFIALGYYRSNTLLKWVISIVPWMLLFLVFQINIQSGGSITRAIGDFLRSSMGDPYKASLTMVAYLVVLFMLVYLMIRRAPLKD